MKAFDEFKSAHDLESSTRRKFDQSGQNRINSGPSERIEANRITSKGSFPVIAAKWILLDPDEWNSGHRSHTAAATTI